MPVNPVIPQIMRASALPGLLLGIVVALQPVQADILTLFTTPQERQLINTNRYITDEVKKPQTVQSEKVENIQQLAQEEITRSYFISGITLSNSGSHTAWINRRAYLDGERLEDKSRIKVLDQKDIRVRITAPDGKHYFGSSGDTIEIKYMAAVEN